MRSWRILGCILVMIALATRALKIGGLSWAPQASLALLVVYLVAWLLRRSLWNSAEAAAHTTSEHQPAEAAAAPSISLHHSNVLQVGAEGRQLWQFTHGGGGVALSAERKIGPEEALPAKLVAKSWQNLWQRKLNVAWLPANQVYLRVLQLPAGEPKELPAMVEFQLEKVSPMPVAQVVWSFEALPSPPGQGQTVVVIIAARTAVESHLDGLEGAGYLADRLELPLVQQLVATTAKGNETWLFTRLEGDRTICLAAWWVEGQLRNLNLFSLPLGADAGAQLADMLQQVAWAGEMEGWLAGPMQWRLVADRATATAWGGALQTVAGGALRAVEPPPSVEVAGLSARACTRTNLVPAEFATRYRQQFIDRLWMRGLGAAGLVCLIVVAAYFAACKYLAFRKGRVDKEIAALSQSYTNACQLKAKVQVFQDQLNLRFAALDCWKAVSENLPAEMNLTSLSFQRGKKLQLIGTVTADQEIKVSDFNGALSKAAQNGQVMFSQVSTRSITGAQPGQQGRGGTWSIDCDVKRVEVE